jgi:hypothetical protein
MRRRNALLGVASLVVVGGFRLNGSEEEGVEAVLFKRLRYLRVDEQGVRQFARDYAARHLISTVKLRAVAVAGSIYRRVPQACTNLLTMDIQFGEERIVTTFLLSSDFFPVGSSDYAAGGNRVIRYLRFFDPLRCGNPFARPVAQEA